MSTKSYIIWYGAKNKVQDIGADIRPASDNGDVPAGGKNSPHQRVKNAQKSRDSAHFAVHISVNLIHVYGVSI
jgi:hypothetical protein